MIGAGCTAKKSPDPANTVRISTPDKIKGFDPANADDLYSGTEISYVYEGLFQYHYLKRPYTLIPALSDGMPKLSEGGKVLTISIKKGVLFHDDACFQATGGRGRELVAEDFVYSWKRLADPALVSPSFWIFDGKVEGLNEWRDEARRTGKADYTKSIEGLQAVDRYTLKIKLKAPNYQFIYALAMPPTFVVAREAVETYGKDFLRNPVGTGPYVNVRSETNLGSRLVYDRNPTYREEFYPSEGEPGDKAAGLLADAGKRLPMSDRLITDVIVESQPMWLNFLAGKLDKAGIPKDSFNQAIGPDGNLSADLIGKGIRLQKNVKLDVTHDSFNMVDPLFGKNKLLRQAISMSINPVPLIEHFYNGQAIAAQGPIPPGLAGYDPKLVNPYRKYNLAKAKELMAQAGYPGGKGLPVFEYQTRSSSTSRQITEYLTKSLAELGIQVKVNATTWPEFQANVKARKGHMWGFAWGADYPDAENFLQLFISKNVSPGPNDSNYSNPEYDRLYDESLKLPDSPKRTALYQQMARMLVEDCPWVFGVHRQEYWLSHGWLKNMKPHELDHAKAKYLRVDPEARK